MLFTRKNPRIIQGQIVVLLFMNEALYNTVHNTVPLESMGILVEEGTTHWRIWGSHLALKLEPMKMKFSLLSMLWIGNNWKQSELKIL